LCSLSLKGTESTRGKLCFKTVKESHNSRNSKELRHSGSGKGLIPSTHMPIHKDFFQLQRTQCPTLASGRHYIHMVHIHMQSSSQQLRDTNSSASSFYTSLSPCMCLKKLVPARCGGTCFQPKHSEAGRGALLVCGQLGSQSKLQASQGCIVIPYLKIQNKTKHYQQQRYAPENQLCKLSFDF
jgi:tRNA(Arg) A34 adenosine deaminase TadA